MRVTVLGVGNRLAVVIPVAILREMRLDEGAPLDVSTSAGVIVMRRPGVARRRPLAQIVAAIRPANYRRRGMERGRDAPAGREHW